MSTDALIQETALRILRARVYEVARETPLDDAHKLSARIGQRV